jgi:hypothetical protein
LFSVLGKLGQFLGADRRRVDLTLKPEIDQFTAGVRKHIDADAKRLDLADGLKHPSGNADLMQAQRKREAADATPGNQDRHR